MSTKSNPGKDKFRYANFVPSAVRPRLLKFLIIAASFKIPSFFKQRKAILKGHISNQYQIYLLSLFTTDSVSDLLFCSSDAEESSIRI